MGRSFLLRKALLFGVGIALFYGTWTLTTDRREAAAKQEFDAYYQAQVAPLIETASTREDQAVALALGRLHEHFDRFRRGAPNFARDMSTWSTRFAITGRSVNDLWTKILPGSSATKRVRELAEYKFRAWVLNEQSLTHALEDSLATYQEATEASRNRLEGEIRLAIGRPDCPIRVPELRMGECFQRATGTARDLAVRSGTSSVLGGGGAFVGSWIATDAAIALTRAVVARMAASGIAATAASGSATAGAATAGGAGGTAAGPAGTIIGLGVGIAVGWIVDEVISDATNAKIQKQVVAYLDGLEKEIVEGTKDQPGMKAMLLKSSREGAQHYRAALLVEMQKAALP
jgi:hypothetical protein